MSSSATPSLRPGLRPVVILGAPRSGTKLLRDLLSQSTASTTFSHGLNHVWRYGLPSEADDQRPASDATARLRRHIRSALLNLVGPNAPSENGFLVEKTCANTLRIPFVDRVLPDAYFIHIVRDGRDAAASARKQWARRPTLSDAVKKLRHVPLRPGAYLTWYARSLCDGLFSNDHPRYWGPRYDGMKTDIREQSRLIVCARQWKACVTACLDDLSQRDAARVTSIRYESLVRNRATIERVISALGLPDADAIRNRYEAIVHDRSVGRWRRDLSPSERKTVHTLLEPTLHRIADFSTLSTA